RSDRLLGEEARARSRRRAGALGHQLLDQVGHALKRSVARRSHRFLEQFALVEIGNGVELVIERPQSLERAVQQLARAELALLYELGDGKRVVRRKEIVQGQFRQRSRLAATKASSFSSG